MRITPLFVTAALLLTTGSAFGASKEQQEMQRDIAQLQDQVRALQSSFDTKMTAVQVLVQQALDAASKANTNVSVLNSSVSTSLERELKQALTPVAGLAAKVDNTNNDVAEVRNQVQDLNASVNRIQQILTDLNNAVKVMQPPQAAAPPPPSPGFAGSAPPPPADALFTSALGDENAGRFDMAISGYQQFIKNYPDNPNAVRAQYNIANCHYTQQKYDLAAADFDALIAGHPDDSTIVPQAYFMKGMSLKGTNKPEARRAWQAVITKYPRSEAASQAREQLRAMGVSTSTTATPPKRKATH
ncbi:MAG TPA: tetratricopeptide repeat protein [Bryobacteraceae bacterium]|nr:tetratricopeptide repeat protein [Bryobacteraceae bacterium]